MAKVVTISEYIKGVSQLITEDGLGYVLAKRWLTGDELLPQYAGYKPAKPVVGDSSSSGSSSSSSASSSSSGEEPVVLTQRDVDLAEGTAYYWLSNLPVGGATEKVSDGGWSHSEGGWTVSKANIEEWLRKYRDLFLKWDEPLLGNSTIRIKTF